MNIGQAWAVMDHFEGESGKPTTTAQLRNIVGVTRSQLRVWEREGRLDVYYVTNDRGTREKAYMRPKERIQDGKVE
jgi:predicted site-specific integrase-resolvase